MSNALEELRKKKANANRPPMGPVTKASQGSYAGNLLRSAVGQGFGLGLGDEIEGAINSGLSQFSDNPKTYQQARGIARSKVKQFQADNPSVAITSEIIGGLVPTVAAMLTGVGAPAAAGNATRLAALGDRVMRAAPVGAAAGYGYSESESLGGQATDASVGAISAVAASEALRQVVKGGAVGYNAVQTALRNKFGNEYAGKVTEYLNRLRERTGKTIDETVDDVRKGGVMAEDDALPASLRGIASEGGEAAGDIKTAASARVDQTMNAANREVKGALAPGIADENVTLAQKTANRELKAYQGEEYQSTYRSGGGITEDVRQKLFEKLSANSRLRKNLDELHEAEKTKNPSAQPLFGQKMDPDSGEPYFDFIREPTLKDAEYVRRILKEMEDNKYVGSKPSTTIAEELGEAEQILRTAIDKASPRLKTNRANYSAREAFDSAFELGKKSHAKSADDLANILDDLDADEIKAFRAGYYTGVRRKLTDRKGSFPAQAGGLERSNSGPYQAMRVMLPEDQADNTIDALARAGRAQQNNTAIKPAGNSMTQFVEEATNEMGTVGKVAALSEAVSFPTPGNVSRAAAAIIPENLGLNDQQKRTVVKILFSEDPDLVRASLTDKTAFGVLNQKVVAIAGSIMQGADSVVKRQVPAGLVENF